MAEEREGSFTPSLFLCLVCGLTFADVLSLSDWGPHSLSPGKALRVTDTSNTITASYTPLTVYKSCSYTFICIILNYIVTEVHGTGGYYRFLSDDN